MKARPDMLAGEELPPEPRQRRSLEKRARLKAAGLLLFDQRGYEGTSVHEIAQLARLATGGFYRHFRSKRQLLLALMEDLLLVLSQLDLRLDPTADARAGLRALLSRSFAHDLTYLGAYRAWQEAVISDPDLANKQVAIHSWTTARIVKVFEALQEIPGARKGVDIPGIARVVDRLFWSLLAEATRLRTAELDRWLDSATHLLYHAMFTDPETSLP